jgi:hypothetical protein
VKLAQSGADLLPKQAPAPRDVRAEAVEQAAVTQGCTGHRSIGQPSPLQQKLIPLYFFIPGRCLPERNACTVIGFPLLEGARRCGTAPGLRDSVLPPSYGGAHV